MFFDRSASKSKSSSLSPLNKQESRTQPTRRNWAALGLAAAIAAPFGALQLTQLQAQDAKPEQLAGPRPSDADLVRQANDEYRHRQFEQAEKTLSVVKADALGQGDREAYSSLAADVKRAAAECRGAREELMRRRRRAQGPAGAGSDLPLQGRWRQSSPTTPPLRKPRTVWLL